MTNNQELEEIHTVLPLLKALVFHLHAAEEETDKEVLTLHIDAIQELEDEICKYWGPKPPVREAIRKGMGDFARIQQKCIDLGLV